MANKKISEMTELASTPSSGDLIEIVDISDTSEAATGTNKKVQYSNLVPSQPAASDTVAGIVELATTAETTTGTDATRAVTPDGLHDMTSLAGAAWMLDEDAMTSNSDTKVPSQQSVKAYVDTSIATQTSKTYVTPVINTSISGTAIASGAEVTTGTDDTQIVTPKALGDAGVNTRLSSKIITGTRDMTAASGDVSYTGVGFTPTSIHSQYAINGSGTVGNGTGFSDSALGNSALNDRQNNGTSNRTTGLIYSDVASGAFQSAIVKSYDADGFTLTWTKTGSPTGTLNIAFLCYR